MRDTDQSQRFKVHSGQANSRSPVTWWVRDSREPKWPLGPYLTRDDAAGQCAAMNASPWLFSDMPNFFPTLSEVKDACDKAAGQRQQLADSLRK